jgi:hypothetical protein
VVLLYIPPGQENTWDQCNLKAANLRCEGRQVWNLTCEGVGKASTGARVSYGCRLERTGERLS